MTLTGFLLVIQRIAPGSAPLWLALAFPGTFQNLIHGQNGFLTAGLLGGGLLLADRKPWLAGCLLGLLTYKPHLAVLVPVALAAGRNWRALAAMLLTCGALVLGSLLVLGPQVWLAFWNNLPFATTLLEAGVLPVHKMPTVFFATQLAGGGPLLSRVLQGLVTIGVTVLVFRVWRRAAPLALRASVLVLAVLLATPYAFEYDLTLLALPLAWLGWEVHTTGWRPWEEPVLILAWVLPLGVASLAYATGCQAGPLVLLALLAVTWRRVATAPPLTSKGRSR